jgi:Uma2 family endonuclease
LRLAFARRRPDLAFVSYGRWPRKKRIPRGDVWDVVPDLPIEVVSPKNTADEILKKIRDYFKFGCKRVWVIYPTEQQIYVYQSPTRNTILTAADELDGEDIHPGFRLPVAALSKLMKIERQAVAEMGAFFLGLRPRSQPIERNPRRERSHCDNW